MKPEQRWPKDSILVDYNAIHKIFGYGSDMTHVQFFMGDSVLDQYKDFWVTWVEQNMYLGWGFTDNREDGRIDWYRFGKEESWEAYLRDVRNNNQIHPSED